MLKPALQKNDRKAKWLIYSFSIIVFLAVVILGKVKLEVDLGFDTHIFAKINAIINSIVTVLLVVAVIQVKQKKYQQHKNSMLAAMLLSVLFLISYIAHHLLNGDTSYGGEGIMKFVYYFILLTHIPLAGIILPFILFTAYRGLTSEFAHHKKMARYTFPLWLYVSITGVLVYLFISPYYQ